MMLSDKDMLELVRTLPRPPLWDREAFVQCIADMRGRPITLVATQPGLVVHSLCGLWLASEDGDVILYEQGASDFRVDQAVYHQIGHMILGHHSGGRAQSRDVRVESAWRRRLPDLAPELVSTVLGSKDYGDEQEYEADLFALLVMNAANGAEHSMIRRMPSTSTVSRSQQQGRECAPSPTADADLALVHRFARELKVACDDLQDEPFNPKARARLMRLILQDSKAADEANKRLLRLRMRAVR